MLRRGSKKNTESDVDQEESAWDIKEREEYEYPTLPAQLLQADEVAAVRFHQGKPGYSFRQVEIFVKQVQQTLTNYEQTIYDKDVLLHEANEELDDLQEKCTTLQATIEVFRAKGDPLINEDGTYVTESQVRAEEALQQELFAVQEALTAAYAANAELQAIVDGSPLSATDEAFIAELTQQNEMLRIALANAEAERDEANTAEAEMREYVEVTLPLWIAQQAAQGEAEETIPAISEENEYDEYAISSASPNEEMEELLQELSDETSEEEGLLLEDSDVIIIDSAEELSTEDLEALSALPDEEISEWEDENTPRSPYGNADDAPLHHHEDRTAEERLSILLSAPEVDGSLISPETLPMPSGGPIEGMPAPPARNKSVLIDAPELQG